MNDTLECSAQTMSDSYIAEQQDKQTALDMEAISYMIKHANNQHLLVEVIWSLLENSHFSDDIPTRCNTALNEWDC